MTNTNYDTVSKAGIQALIKLVPSGIRRASGRMFIRRMPDREGD